MKESKDLKKKLKVIDLRTYDARTLLYNLFYDGKVMLDGGRETKEIAKVVEDKVKFLMKPPAGFKIRW